MLKTRGNHSGTLPIQHLLDIATNQERKKERQPRSKGPTAARPPRAHGTWRDRAGRVDETRNLHGALCESSAPRRLLDPLHAVIRLGRARMGHVKECVEAPPRACKRAYRSAMQQNYSMHARHTGGGDRRWWFNTLKGRGEGGRDKQSYQR
eukprot:366490-Chlamydomonas_euryale.AAC.19